MIREVTQILSSGNNLGAAQMSIVMEEIMSGSAHTPEIISFLKALDNKGETVIELAAAVGVMRQHVSHIKAPNSTVLDTCGTGGDAKGTFNISTASAFVASGAGICVAKHGNRSISSSCGSADVLEALGVNINMSVSKIEECLSKIGIAFLFAPNLHPAMKYAMPARKEIGKRTVFNILGPLSNPAEATHQLVGVYERRWVAILAEVFLSLGSKRALVVHADDGLDEISTTSPTFIGEAYNGKVNTFTIEPEDFGIKRAKMEDLRGADIKQNTKMLLDALRGEDGPVRDIVVLNAAAGIFAAGGAKTIQDGIILAKSSIDSGKALEKLELLKNMSKNG